MNSRETVKAKELQAELVVVGGGGAGLAAAVTAAEKGASVIVLEKRGAVGGNSARAVGPFAADSPAQKRAHVVAHSDDLFKIAMNWAHWRVNPRIVRAYFDRSGDTVRWFEEKGLRFQLVALWPGQNPLVWHTTEGRGAELIKVLSDECKRLGVQVLVDTPARKILTGARGEVTGVLAEKEGEPLKITAKCVFIGTGGYGGNRELLRRYSTYYNDNMDCIGFPHMGDGLMMATEIGAATEGLGILQLGGPTVPDHIMLHLGDESNTLPVPLMAIGLQPYTVWVNKKGMRFIGEDVGYNHYLSSNAVALQPENTSYSLLDSGMTQKMTEEGLLINVGKTRERQREKLPPGLERELRLQADRGDRVRICNSWDEMADWIGASPNVLKATIDEYNAACDRGYDSLFVKDRRHLLPLRTPPYYAIRCKADYLDTIGGIKINERMEVLDKQDNPIPGLYAGGVDVGGWSSDTYCAQLSGGTLGFAFTSGRIAAENAIRTLGLGKRGGACV